MSAAEKMERFNSQTANRNLKLIPVHITRDEARYYNYLQGGQQIDPETHLRMYPGLLKVIETPEIADLFVKFYSYVHQNHLILPPVDTRHIPTVSKHTELNRMYVNDK